MPVIDACRVVNGIDWAALVMKMIDWKRVKTLKQEVGGEAFEEVVVLFFAEVERALVALEKGHEQTTQVQVMHLLKGIAVNLGFERLAAYCAASEVAGARNAPAADNHLRICQIYAQSKEAFIAGLPDLRAT